MLKRDVPAVPSLDPTLSHGSLRTCKAASPQARALSPEGPAGTGLGGAGRRLRAPRLRTLSGPRRTSAAAAGALGAALPPLPPPSPPPPRRRPPGGPAPLLPRAGSAAGGASSGPLCAARRDVSAARAGMGRDGRGGCGIGSAASPRRAGPAPARPSLHPAGSGARLGPPRCPRGKRAGGGTASLFSSGVCRVAAGWPG